MKPSKTSRNGVSVSRVILPLAAAAALAAFAGGCSKKGPQAAAPGALEVGVHTLKAEHVSLNRELPGRTSPYRVAEVRARVSGIVQKRLFTEGEVVKEGQPLYQIDDAPYVAALESAKAALARSEANFANARAQAVRFAELVKVNAISQQDHDTVMAQAKAFAADVEAGKAAVRNAQINLDYTRVLSPISGRTGLSAVTEGAYVQAASATLLTTVRQTDKVYVDLVQPAESVMKLKADLESGRIQSTTDGKARISLFFDDGTRYPVEGTLEFSDIAVSPSTSSITMRAVFPNPRGDLLPGLFVRASLLEGVRPNAVLVPQVGVTRNPRGQATTIVIVQKTRPADTKVGKPGETYTGVEQRVITLDRAMGDKWLVADGLKAGDQVVVENLQMLQRYGLNAEVKPSPAGGKKPDATAAPVATAK